MTSASENIISPDDMVVVTFSPSGSSAAIFPTDGAPRQYFHTRCNPDDSAAAELRCAEDAVFDHPELLEAERPPLVLTDWPRRIVIPRDADISDDEALSMARDMFPGSADYEMLTTEVDDVVVVSLVPRGLPGFILRTFPDNQPADRLAAMLGYFRREAKSGENKLCIHIAGDSLDAAAFRGTGLQLLTSLKATSTDEMLYFIAAIWDNIGFSNTTDALLMSGDAQECRRMATRLSKRLTDVRIAKQPDVAPHIIAQAVMAAKI